MSEELLVFKINEIQKDVIGLKQNLLNREKDLCNRGKITNDEMQERWMKISHDFNNIYYILDDYRNDIIDIKVKEEFEK